MPTRRQVAFTIPSTCHHNIRQVTETLPHSVTSYVCQRDDKLRSQCRRRAITIPAKSHRDSTTLCDSFFPNGRTARKQRALSSDIRSVSHGREGARFLAPCPYLGLPLEKSREVRWGPATTDDWHSRTCGWVLGCACVEGPPPFRRCHTFECNVTVSR